MRAIYWLPLLCVTISCASRREYQGVLSGASRQEAVDTTADTMTRATSRYERERDYWVIDVVRDVVDVAPTDTMEAEVSSRVKWHIEAHNDRESASTDSVWQYHRSVVNTHSADTMQMQVGERDSRRSTSAPWGAYIMVAVLSIVAVGLIVKH